MVHRVVGVLPQPGPWALAKDGNLLPECPVPVGQESPGRVPGHTWTNSYGQIIAMIQAVAPKPFLMNSCGMILYPSYIGDCFIVKRNERFRTLLNCLCPTIFKSPIFSTNCSPLENSRVLKETVKQDDGILQHHLHSKYGT